MRPLSLLIVVAGIAAGPSGSGVARAQEARAGGARVEEEEEVLVRGAAQAGGFVSRTRVEDAPREITDAASLVEPMPGVHVRRLGADDSFATLSVRGTSSTQVAVFLAGVPLTGGADPTLDLATLPVWPGAQARVFRSFAPAALGRGSLGGTLVLDPPSPRAPARTDVWAAIGSFGSRRVRIGDVRDEGGVRIATALSASRSDDDFTYLDPNATRFRGEDVFATRRNAGHAQVSGLVSVALPVRMPNGELGALTSTTLAQARKQELPGTISVPTIDNELQSTRLVSALELTVPSGRGAFGVRAWGRRDGLHVRSGLETVKRVLGPRATDDAIVAAGSSVGWRGRPNEATMIEARVDGSLERFAPGTWVGAVQPPGARRTNGGLALDATVRAAEKTTIAASGRGDVWFDASQDGASTSDVRPTAHLGLEQGLGPIVLASHGGMLARPATFVERYGNRGTFIGEPSLRPESAVTVDAGARTAAKMGALRMHFELAGFTTWADDLIVFVVQGAQGLARATNIGRARLAGLEGLAQASAWGFDLRLSYTGLATANLAEIDRPPLPGRPEHDLVGDLAWQRGPVRLRYGVDVMTGMRADIRGEIPVPARAIHGAGVRVAVPGVRGLSLSFDVRNLFDLRVGEVPNALGGTDRVPIGDLFDYPLPGRRFLATARWVSN
jgi:iron complex outermembrane receptor protein